MITPGEYTLLLTDEVQRAIAANRGRDPLEVALDRTVPHARLVATCGGDGAPHFVREQEGVFFGGNHVRKDTFFFGSPLHAARVASAKTA